MLLKCLIGFVLIPLACIAQVEKGELIQVTIAALGESGTAYEFKIDEDADLRANCGPIPLKYSSTHLLRCRAGSNIKIAALIRAKALGGLDKRSSLNVQVALKTPMLVLPVEEEYIETDGHIRRRPLAIVLPKGYCQRSGTKWLKIGLVNSNRNYSLAIDVLKCSAEFSHWNSGLYVGTLLVDGNPYGAIKFYRYWSRSSQIIPEIITFEKR